MAFAGFVVQRSVAQACGDTLTVEVTPDYLIEDTGGFTTLGGGVYSMAVPGDGAGVYLLAASAYLSGLAKLALVEVTVTRNATETILLIERLGDAAGTALHRAVQCFGVYRLMAGDVIKMKVSQTSGGSLNVSTSTSGITQLQAIYIGP